MRQEHSHTLQTCQTVGQTHQVLRLQVSLCMLSSLPWGGGVCDIVGEDVRRGTLGLNAFDQLFNMSAGRGNALAAFGGTDFKTFSQNVIIFENCNKNLKCFY